MGWDVIIIIIIVIVDSPSLLVFLVRQIVVEPSLINISDTCNTSPGELAMP